MLCMSSDVCGGLAPSLLSGDVPEAAVSPGEGTLLFLLPLPQWPPDHTPLWSHDLLRLHLWPQRELRWTNGPSRKHVLMRCVCLLPAGMSKHQQGSS